jgi:hypothetical protein
VWSFQKWSSLLIQIEQYCLDPQHLSNYVIWLR